MKKANSDLPMVDRERETLPPDYQDRPTVVDEPRPRMVADICRAIIMQAYILSQCRQFDAQTRAKFWFIRCKVDEYVKDHAGISALLLKESTKRLLETYVPGIEKTMRTLKASPPEKVKEAYVRFTQACSQLN